MVESFAKTTFPPRVADELKPFMHGKIAHWILNSAAFVESIARARVLTSLESPAIIETKYNLSRGIRSYEV